jgi:hypothetical protein
MEGSTINKQSKNTVGVVDIHVVGDGSTVQEPQRQVARLNGRCCASMAVAGWSRETDRLLGEAPQLRMVASPSPGVASPPPCPFVSRWRLKLSLRAVLYRHLFAGQRKTFSPCTVFMCR